MPAVVTPNYDDRVSIGPCRLQLVQHATLLSVHVADACIVTAHGFPLFERRERPPREQVDVPAKLIWRHTFQQPRVGIEDRWRQHRLRLVEIEKVFRCQQRNVRLSKPDRQNKWLRGSGPFPQFGIGFIGYFSVEAAIPGCRVFGLLTGALGRREPGLRSLRQRLIGSKPRVLRMPNLFESSHGISVPGEVGRNHRLTRFQLQKSVVVKRARPGGVVPGEHRRMRRMAKRKLAVGLLETYALPSMAVKVRNPLEDVAAKR